MVVTVLKTTIQKNKPREKIYGDYSKFNEDVFRDNLINKFSENDTIDYEVFESIFLQVLNTHAPLKKKMVRANHIPYMTKTLRKAIMRRSALENKYYKSKSLKDKEVYKKQRKFCNRLYKRERRKYFNNLNLENIVDNKIFWRTMKPFYPTKVIFITILF